MNPRGLTLVEMLVVLAILGLMAGVVAVRLEFRPAPPREGTVTGDARRRAIGEARPVSVLVTAAGRVTTVTALPDGRVLSDTSQPTNLFTGRPRASH